jgi:MFS family permease
MTTNPPSGLWRTLAVLVALCWRSLSISPLDLLCPHHGNAAAFYGVSDLSIGLLSMSFMIAYLFVSVPASWVIDTYGFRVAVAIGAALTAVFGMMRGLLGADYNLVLLAQIGIAIGQPFILNAVTKVAARWFPRGERATSARFTGDVSRHPGGMPLTPYITPRWGSTHAPTTGWVQS